MANGLDPARRAAEKAKPSGRRLLAAALLLTTACSSPPVSPSPSAPAPSVPAPSEAVIDLSANVPHRMTPGQVTAVVLRQIAGDAERVGRNLAQPRVLSVTLMAPNELYPVEEYGEGGGLSHAFVAWAVEWQGTGVETLCGGGECQTFTEGTYIVDDATGEIRGSARSGEVP